MFLKLCLLAAALLISTHQTEAKTDKILCFFASWAGYRNGEGSFKPQNINANLCTHVHYAFLGVNSDGTLKILDSWNEIDLHGLENVANLKSINPELKVLISIGGWNAGNAILNGIVASSKLRASLISSCLSFFSQWGYDGIDIDWEYPANADKENFVKLLQEMRQAFGSKYVLSVTVSANPLQSYDIPEINKVVDFINIMSYDYHTADQPQTGLNAPLYGNSMSVDTSVQSWLRGGASASKVTLSVPSYGHSWYLQSTSNHDVGAPATTGIAGPFTQSPGVLGFNEICSFYSDWTRVWLDDAKVPYKYDGTNWVSYDDEQSIGLKAKYAKDNGLAGVAVWSIDTDDFLGSCGTKDALLQAIKNNID